MTNYNKKCLAKIFPWRSVKDSSARLFHFIKKLSKVITVDRCELMCIDMDQLVPFGLDKIYLCRYNNRVIFFCDMLPVEKYDM